MLVVAGLPALATDSSPSKDERFREALVDRLERGEQPLEIARKVYPTQKRAQKRLRNRIWRMGATDPHLASLIHMRAHAILLFGLIPASEALARRAGRGNVPAAKLHLEASGFHNPRVQHEHSGEITVKLDMPRPKFVDAASTDEPVADAEVVD